MSIDFNVGVQNSFILNNAGTIRGFGQSIISFFDPSFGLPILPNLGDKYIALNTANGWILNNIEYYDGVKWNNYEPVSGSIIWVSNIAEARIFNPLSNNWENLYDDSDVITGPVTSTFNSIPRFNDLTGNTLKSSNVIIDDLDNLTTGGDLNSLGLNSTNLTTTGNIDFTGATVIGGPFLTVIPPVEIGGIPVFANVDGDTLLQSSGDYKILNSSIIGNNVSINTASANNYGIFIGDNITIGSGLVNTNGSSLIMGDNNSINGSSSVQDISILGDSNTITDITSTESNYILANNTTITNTNINNSFIFGDSNQIISTGIVNNASCILGNNNTISGSPSCSNIFLSGQLNTINGTNNISNVSIINSNSSTIIADSFDIENSSIISGDGNTIETSPGVFQQYIKFFYIKWFE